MLAAKLELVTMVELLLRRGACLYVAVPREIRCWSEGECAKLFCGATAVLHAAVLYGKLDVLRLLLSWGGDLNVVESIRCTPLHTLWKQVREDAKV